MPLSFYFIKNRGIDTHTDTDRIHQKFGSVTRFFLLLFVKVKVLIFNFFILRMDLKRADNMEMRNGNAYPTLPLVQKQPKAPLLESE